MTIRELKRLVDSIPEQDLDKYIQVWKHDETSAEAQEFIYLDKEMMYGDWMYNINVGLGDEAACDHGEPWDWLFEEEGDI
jgi:hypothetical protein